MTLANGKPAAPERITRRKKLLDDNASIPLPYLDSTYVPDLLFEIGPVSYGGMGAAPISHVDLRAWMQNNVELPPWLSRMLIRLSHDYLAESQRAEKRDCPPPWEEESQEERRERIETQVRSAMRAMR